MYVHCYILINTKIILFYSIYTYRSGSNGKERSNAEDND